jgi:lipoyl(octanoyl) transferase
MISVLQLGTQDYATALALQRKLVDLRKINQIGDVLLLLEHPPVITLGRNAQSANILASPEILVQRGVEVAECDRGGDVTFHGPGQLVGYPIFDLRAFTTPTGERKTLGAIEFVRKMEEALIRTCADFRIPATRIPKLTGVWTSPATSPAAPATEPAKIAAIGIHISRAVTSHGFALNVNTDLSFFDLIVPCGLVAKPVTSIQQETGAPVSLDRVAESISRNFGHVFSRQMLWLESLDALLGNTLGVPVRPPASLRKLRGEDETFWA